MRAFDLQQNLPRLAVDRTKSLIPGGRQNYADLPPELKRRQHLAELQRNPNVRRRPKASAPVAVVS